MPKKKHSFLAAVLAVLVVAVALVWIGGIIFFLVYRHEFIAAFMAVVGAIICALFTGLSTESTGG